MLQSRKSKSLLPTLPLQNFTRDKMCVFFVTRKLKRFGEGVLFVVSVSSSLLIPPLRSTDSELCLVDCF